MSGIFLFLFFLLGEFFHYFNKLNSTLLGEKLPLIVFLNKHTNCRVLLRAGSDPECEDQMRRLRAQS